MREGYIKFQCNWIKESPLPLSLLTELNRWRSKLYTLGLIGIYPDGIGYGNISNRHKNNQFIITGSDTGAIKELSSEHYTLVADFSIEKNSLVCNGPIKASSESLSHAVCYLNPEINAVIHIHSKKLWNRLKDKIPTTPDYATYGTPEMANEISKLISLPTGLVVMGGHEDGIIAYGKDLKEAGAKILKFRRTLGR